MRRDHVCVAIALLGCGYFVGRTTADNARPPRYTIANCVTTFDADKVERTGAGYQFWFADKQFADGKTLKLSAVRANSASHAPHEHEEDEFFFVLEGTAEFHLNGETATGGPLTSFYCPTGSTHGIRNAGDTELKYLVIKKYPPGK
ncbi:MAG: cupin [Planctomycetaceae bacterium]|nr:cupin [Planctomycetaceae bacterium]